MDKIAAWLDRHNVNLVAAFVTAIHLVGAGIFLLKATGPMRLVQGNSRVLESTDL
jgi:hypothetical protein